MLQNAYSLAKIGADTAENEQHFAEILPKIGNYPTGRTGRRSSSRVAGAPWYRRGTRAASSEPEPERTAPRGLRLDSAPTRLRGCEGGWKDSNV